MKKKLDLFRNSLCLEKLRFFVQIPNRILKARVEAWSKYSAGKMPKRVILTSKWNSKRGLFLLGSLFLIISADFTRHYFKGRTEVPPDLRNHFLELVENPKEIKFPSFVVRPTNPGVIEYKDGYLMVTRAKSYDWISYIKRRLRIKRDNYLCFVRLDKDFNVVPNQDGSFLQPISHDLISSRAIDARLIEVNHQIYMIYCDYFFQDKLTIGRSYLSKIEENHDGFRIAKPIELSFPDAEKYYELGLTSRVCEKNLTPFVFKDKLYLVYLIDPLVVIEPDLESGICKEIARNEEFPIWEWGMASGGTPAIDCGEGYLSFFHTHAKGFKVGHQFFKNKYKEGLGTYIFSAYLFNKEYPFNRLKKIDLPLSGKGLYEGKKKIIFPMALFINDGEIKLVYGRDDCKAFVGTIDRAKLINLLN